MARVRRGDVVLVQLTKLLGSEAREPFDRVTTRPCVVVQNDTGNRTSLLTIVVPLMRALPNTKYPGQPLIDPHVDPVQLSDVSVADCAQIHTIRQESVVRGLGRLNPTQIESLDKALRMSLGLSF